MLQSMQHPQVSIREQEAATLAERLMFVLFACTICFLGFDITFYVTGIASDLFGVGVDIFFLITYPSIFKVKF